MSREENVIQEDSILPEVTENHSKSTTEQSAQQSPQAPPSSLETLASQMKEMSLPIVDTNGWKKYMSSSLNIEFMYPKEWIIKIHDEDSAFYGKICIGNAKFSQVLIEGESECIIQFDKTKYPENKLVEEIQKNYKSTQFSSIKSLQMSPLALHINDGLSAHVYFVGEGAVQKIALQQLVSIGDEDAEIRQVFYGILSTLKLTQ